MEKVSINYNTGASVLWLISVIYAFTKWGVLHGIINIFIPYAIAYDIVIKLISIL